ncbi:DUF6177 family protein [Streptomyces sp. NPDC058297]|uniref:DUF6177 family protein n=1 Tax=Streptomyces sp. NPDC058297 TaxID=3346433 RepID=UPI0036DFE707
MTKDVIALTANMPDTKSLLTALYAGGPHLTLAATDNGAVLQLCTPDGRPLVSVEAPLLIHTPGEAERLLGPHTNVPELPFWWTEARAATAVPEAEDLAGSICGRLTTLLGGTVWPPEAATTRTITTTEDPAEKPDATPDPGAAVPTVDVLTDSTAVVIADRPTLPLTSWLSNILRETTATSRALHLVTPPHSRLTLPLRTALGGTPNRWVVQHPQGGYYDGLAGVPLAWRDGTFTPTDTTLTDAFTSTATAGQERQLIVSFRTVHPAKPALILGQALETAWQHLTGAAPAGWGTAEPVNLPWSPSQLTDLARDRAPAPTHLFAVGSPDRPAIATHRITRTTAGVAEESTLTLGYTNPQDVPLDSIESLASTLTTKHDLTSMLTTLRAARADLTLPPHLEGPPVPVAFTLGPRDVQTIGLQHAQHAPIPTRPKQLGITTRPTLHYSLGNGTTADAWTTLQQLTTHLNAGPTNGS